MRRTTGMRRTTTNRCVQGQVTVRSAAFYVCSKKGKNRPMQKRIREGSLGNVVHMLVKSR